MTAGSLLCIIGGLVAAAVVAGLLLGVSWSRTRCGICGIVISKTRYHWRIGKRKTTLCPNCNRRMADRISAAAFRRFGG